MPNLSPLTNDLALLDDDAGVDSVGTPLRLSAAIGPDDGVSL
jgi:type IV secretion system protein VirD4